MNRGGAGAALDRHRAYRSDGHPNVRERIAIRIPVLAVAIERIQRLECTTRGR